jgi:hypothetical protein
VYKDKASGDMKPGKKGISLTLDQVSLDYYSEATYRPAAAVEMDPWLR